MLFVIRYQSSIEEGDDADDDDDGESSGREAM